MKEKAQIEPEFKAKMRSIGKSIVVTIPAHIFETWGISRASELRLRIIEEIIPSFGFCPATMLRDCADLRGVAV